MSKTLLDIRTEVRDYIDENTQTTWTNAVLNRMINNTYKHEAMEIRKYYWKTSTITTTSGTNYTALPTDCVNVCRITDSDGINLHPTHLREYNYITTGEPAKFEIRHTKVYWEVVPDGAYTYTIEYNYLPAEMDEDTDVLDFPLGFEEIIVLGSVIRAKIKYDETAQDVKGDFQIAKIRLKQHLASRQSFDSKKIMGGLNNFGELDV